MNTTKHERLGFLFLLTAIGLWSTVEVAVRTLHAAIPPIQFAWVRFALGALFLLALLPFELRRRGLRLNASIIRFAAWSSLPGIAVSSIALQYGLTLSGAAVIATVYGAAPLFVMALSRVLLGDSMTTPRIIGLASGFIGIVLLASGKPSPTFSLPGVGCALISVGSFCLWAVLVKKYAGPFGGLPITALSFVFGVAFMTPLMLWENGGLDLVPLLQHPWRVLYLSVGTTGIAYWVYFMGLERIDATQAMSVILLKPPMAAVLAMLVLGEPLTWNVIAAMALILSGLYGVVIWDRRMTARRHHSAAGDSASGNNVLEQNPCPRKTTP